MWEKKSKDCLLKQAIFMPLTKMIQIFLNVFAGLDNINPPHLLVAGDMNVAFGSLDYTGSHPIHSNINSHNALNSLIDEFDLLDVRQKEHPNLRVYRRHQKKKKKKKKERKKNSGSILS